MLKTNISKKRVLAIASALIIASTSLHTHTVTTPQARSTQSTQAIPVKTTKPTHSTQSAKSTSTQINTIARTVLKAGYNAAKAIGMGISGIIVYGATVNSHLLKTQQGLTNTQITYLGLCSLITIPALAKSIYNSYTAPENKQNAKNDSSTIKTVAKTMYNIAKANGIVASTYILHNLITQEKNSNPFVILCNLGVVSTIAALGESIYNDYKHLKTENNTAAATK